MNRVPQPSDLNRRSFIGHLAWLVAALPLLGPGVLIASRTEAVARKRMTRAAYALAGRGDAWRLGRAYLRERRGEARLDLLADTLWESVGRASPALDKRRLHMSLANATRRDFEAGRITEVDGWRLSETEARVCALAWLCRRSERQSRRS